VRDYHDKRRGHPSPERTPGIAERIGGKSLALFGSAARGELRPDSDIDLLADLEPPYTYDRYFRVKFFIDDLL
jgi:predicted nucleotidyltransferase